MAMKPYACQFSIHHVIIKNPYKKYGVTVLLDFLPEIVLINQQLLEEAYQRYGLAEDTIYVGYGDYESGIIGEISRHNLLTPSEGIEFECINEHVWTDAEAACLQMSQLMILIE